MLTAEPVDLRGRRALAKSLEKEKRHATDQLKQALKASNAAVDELRAVGSELEDEAERVSERAKKDRARVDDVEAQCAYAKARRAELDLASTGMYRFATKFGARAQSGAPQLGGVGGGGQSTRTHGEAARDGRLPAEESD